MEVYDENAGDDINDEFDLAPCMNEEMNSFRIVHLKNQNDTYHLMRQILLDSMLTQDTYCFFYHILAKGVDDFNVTYGSFACLMPQDDTEANLYLNVDSNALHHIVKYIQTTKIDIMEICKTNNKTIDEMIDLATMFGMPNLVLILRNVDKEKCNVQN